TKSLTGALTALALVLVGMPAMAAEGADYNSSRSNKSHGIAEPDLDASGGPTGETESQADATPVRAKMDRRPPAGGGAGGASSTQAASADLSGEEGGQETRKAFAVPHMLETQGRTSGVSSSQDGTDDPQPQGMAINEKGLPGDSKAKPKKATK